MAEVDPGSVDGIERLLAGLKREQKVSHVAR